MVGGFVDVEVPELLLTGGTKTAFVVALEVDQSVDVEVARALEVEVVLNTSKSNFRALLAPGC